MKAIFQGIIKNIIMIIKYVKMVGFKRVFKGVKILQKGQNCSFKLKTDHFK